MRVLLAPLPIRHQLNKEKFVEPGTERPCRSISLRLLPQYHSRHGENIPFAFVQKSHYPQVFRLQAVLQTARGYAACMIAHCVRMIVYMIVKHDSCA